MKIVPSLTLNEIKFPLTNLPSLNLRSSLRAGGNIKKGLNWRRLMKKILISTVAIFVFTFFYEFLVHGFLLTDAYEKTATLWRPDEEYKMGVMALRQILVSILLAGFYFKAKPPCPMMFGGFIGLLLAAIEVGKYSYMPIPLSLSLSWAGAALVYGVAVGGILALVVRKCCGPSCCKGSEEKAN